MSVRLFNLLVSSLRQNLPKYSLVKSGVQARSMNAMDVITETVEEDNPDLVKAKVLTRYKKRFMKRQWEDNPRDRNENGESDEKRVCDKPFERIKKKKMAMLLGYSGVDYYGMQRNPDVPTIEEDLLKALKECKYITEEDFVNQQNAQFQRSSRTDKGVSAARQVVSLKMPLEFSIEEINNKLPKAIRVFGIKRVTNKFNSKTKCNARTYSYTLPTYTFEPTAEDEVKRKAYRITVDKIGKVNDVLAFYKGTKSYHNFTEKKHFHDPSACRYMMSFTLDKVFVASDMEFAVLLVKGQSFMLHQIRKMIGLTVGIVRGHTDISIMDKVFGKDKVMIPTVPGLGLVLEKVHYERYDAKFKDSHDSLTWDDEEEAIEKFKHDQIFPNIIKGELEDNSMANWLEKLKKHSYEPSDEVPDEKEDNLDAGDDDDDDVADKDDEIDKCDGNEAESKVKVNDIAIEGTEVEKDSVNVISDVNMVEKEENLDAGVDVADEDNKIDEGDGNDEAKTKVRVNDSAIEDTEVEKDSESVISDVNTADDVEKLEVDNKVKRSESHVQ